VFELLTENGLGRFYELNPHPGLQTSGAARREQWAFLDAPELQRQVLDFSDDKSSRVTFHVPAIHCVACVWLLENLFRLHPGVGRSQVNFPRREVAITFAPDKMQLSELVALLASLGYEPALSLGSLEKPPTDPARQRQWLQVGVAGFAFGNIMLLSLPGYLGLDSLSGPFFRAVFGYLSLGLALPVLLYSASDYWRSALRSFRQRAITLDVPIALGVRDSLRARRRLPGLAHRAGVLPLVRAGVSAEDARAPGLRPRLQELLPALGGAAHRGGRSHRVAVRSARGRPPRAAPP
jgi:Cu+-exporting ATPase